MMKKLFLLCCFFAVTLTTNANGWINFQENLGTVLIDPLNVQIF